MSFVLALMLALSACGPGEPQDAEGTGPGEQPKKPKVVYRTTVPEHSREPGPVENPEQASENERTAERSAERSGERSEGQTGEPVGGTAQDQRWGPEDDDGNRDAYATVTEVVDGDTIRISPAVDGLDTIRLTGIDTPETRAPGTGVQPYGEEASAFARVVLAEQRVGLELDVEEVDRYGRLLAYVWMPGGEMVNEVLLREGYAQVATFPPNVKYTDRFLAAQEEARTEGRGLWGLPEGELCELADRGNGIGGGCEAPVEYEPAPAPEGRSGAGGEAAAPVSANECPQSHPIKGNHSSSGELIYHVSGGQFYDATNPEECFASEGDARAAGYRASQR